MALSRTLSGNKPKLEANVTKLVPVEKAKPINKAVVVSKVEPTKKPLPAKKPRTTEQDEDDSLELAILPPKKSFPVAKKNTQLALPAPSSSSSGDEKEDNDPNTEHQFVVDGVEVNKVRVLTGVKKSSLRRLNTMFGQRSDAIIDLLEFGDQDGALGLISKSILQTLVDILPVIERGIRRSKGTRGVYQLNQTISQMREMCSDIQAYKDKSMLGSTIVERHIRPSYLDIAVQITSAFAELEASSRMKMPREEFEIFREDGLNQMKRNLADYIKHQYEEVSEGIIKSLT